MRRRSWMPRGSRSRRPEPTGGGGRVWLQLTSKGRRRPLRSPGVVASARGDVAWILNALVVLLLVSLGLAILVGIVWGVGSYIIEEPWILAVFFGAALLLFLICFAAGAALSVCFGVAGGGALLAALIGVAMSAS